MKSSMFLVYLFVSLTASMPVSARESPHEHLGTVEFANSCAASVQEPFQRAVAMLHSFRYLETEKAFREVLAEDPSCAVADWGIAAILMSNPLAGVGPSPDWAGRAQAAIDQGRTIGAKTQRERDYIGAVAAYYEDWANRPERTRQLNRAKAFEALAARYPDDDEAQIFHALYLAATQALADQSYKNYLAAAAILEKQFEKHPNHPGVAHYLIHSYDAPAIAAMGLVAARRYAAIAPSAPHAQHMPSHIFTRVGSWKESIATNERAADAAKQDGDFDEQLHATDYLVYALLQLGRDDVAHRLMEESATITGFTTLRFAGPYAQAAIPARYAIERGDWKQAMTLEPHPGQFPFTVALTYFARALGAARSGDAAAAGKDVEELSRLRDTLKAAKNEYWANEVEISRLEAAAWTALAQGEREEALLLMRSAAEIEDKSEKHIVTPGRIVPARELLGEMLLELKLPADALREFEASQLREPERFHGYYGAAQAAAQSGDLAKTRRYFERLVEMAGQGSARPELAAARAFLTADSVALPGWTGDEAEIRAATAASADAWNRGDIKGHLAIYDESVTFMTSNGPRPGVAPIEAAFLEKYFVAGMPKQNLGFSDISVRRLDGGAALETGRFLLTGGGLADQSGWFTLVWLRTPAGWRAVHDHSS
ncbi:MAG: nuclear transport factor 2 family protein [Gammaproteobacteria bacterium]|nr:nuclear transport factor 2 family protein [Gammaproteobacteria bacterium]